MTKDKSLRIKASNGGIDNIVDYERAGTQEMQSLKRVEHNVGQRTVSNDDIPCDVKNMLTALIRVIIETHS